MLGIGLSGVSRVPIRSSEVDGSDPATPMIKAVNLYKDYGDFRAVDGIQFEVMPGEIFGMLGPNGAGKTTTMRMLACISPVTAGELHVDGLSVMDHPRQIRDRIGVVAQQDGLDPDLNVMQNLTVYARYFGMTGRVAKDRAREMLEFFALENRSDDGIHTLSGGMKRRLALARAFMTRPRIVILDEPTTGLDPQSRNSVWEQLERIKAAGATILMSTHYMEEAAVLCDRLVIMDHGKILANGTPDDLVAEHAGAETAIVRPDPDRRKEVERALAALDVEYRDRGRAIAVFNRNGVKLDLDGLANARVRIRASTLEDVFLNLTGRQLRDE
ncbi:MAG: ABC transporter ATP-binding protein [Chloroflexi bacterium]|nr:ABC transporter ATP-binding protein [Chloroflexota bacterium]